MKNKIIVMIDISAIPLGNGHNKKSFLKGIAKKIEGMLYENKIPVFSVSNT